MTRAIPVQKVLMIDAANAICQEEGYELGTYFGPVDLGLHLAQKFNSLSIGVGVLAGSIFPGSSRLIFSGISPCWHGFFISSMGGAGLVFDKLGVNMVSIFGRTTTPSILYLHKGRDEAVSMDFMPVNPDEIWAPGRGGVYAVMGKALSCFGSRFENNPRILATGPAARYTDFGGIASAPVKHGRISHIDTWAGRGGFGSKLFQQHGIVGIIYGGTYSNQHFRDKQLADQWFLEKYNQDMGATDKEATSRYRFDPTTGTAGTFGLNFAKLQERIIAFNYKTIYMPREERLHIHKHFIVDHYLKQFNEETLAGKQSKTCGESCAALCKKVHGPYKKDFAPYQSMGPLCGIFDQRAAELLNHHADNLGFDAISIGGILAWLMDCLENNLLTPEQLGVENRPVFSPKNFRLVEDSMHNAQLAVALLNQICSDDAVIDLSSGARKFARKLAQVHSRDIPDRFVYLAAGREGWMVPKQYWSPGVLSPMPVMGRYYMNHGREFLTPRELGRQNAVRMLRELMLDNLGICRFHRAWAEDMMPEIIDRLYGLKKEFLQALRHTANTITGLNEAITWESKKNSDFVYRFLVKKRDEDGCLDKQLKKWIEKFEKNPDAAAFDFLCEIHQGVQETLIER